METRVDGSLAADVTAKDLVLTIIARIGTGGGIGSIIEYRGSAIRSLSMEGRMTVCNMSIEAGGRGGEGAPDGNPLAHPHRPPFPPPGRGGGRAPARRRKRPAGP